jgi:hypothetical protein
MDLIIVAAVVTNGAMIVFTMQLVRDYSTFTQFWVFIGFQWVLFFVQYVIRAIIPDIPFEVEIQTDRADFLNRKIIEREPDVEDEFIGEDGKKHHSHRSMNLSKEDTLTLLNGMIHDRSPVPNKPVDLVGSQASTV